MTLKVQLKPVADEVSWLAETSSAGSVAGRSAVGLVDEYAFRCCSASPASPIRSQRCRKLRSRKRGHPKASEALGSVVTREIRSLNSKKLTQLQGE